MNAEAIFSLIAKGLSILPILIQAGESVEDTIERLRALSENAANGVPVSDADLASLEADLDAAIAKFNEPMV